MKFQVLLWDDFHDDGSEEPTLVASVDTFEEARSIARAYIRRLRASGVSFGGFLYSTTVVGPENSPGYYSNDDPESREQPTKEDLDLLFRLKKG